MAKMTETRSFKLIGEEREGGYTYIYSKDLPGFSFMLEPGEDDIKVILEAIEPALKAYVKAYLRHEFQIRPQPTMTKFRRVDLSEGNGVNLYGELCTA